MEKEMYKPHVGYEMCGDKVFLVIPQGNYNERRLVMTKDLFIVCYEHWIKKVEHDRQPAEKTGKWIVHTDKFANGDEYFGYATCSECGEMFYAIDTIGKKPIWDYCPYCGARMVD